MAQPDIPTIGKYEVQAELGQGGFGKVYRAYDPTVGRQVAIKILTTEGNKDLLNRFRNEATAAGKLKHKNIVTVYEFGEHEGRPFLVMELLEGQDLVQIIKDGAKLSLLQKMNIMDQVADGLDCAHGNGVIHRDIKPANIRLLPDGTVKIMDFGIARVSRDNETRLTRQGDLIGTVLYMSPEQFTGKGADVLSDVFAYGVVYYELLTGKHPFEATDPVRVMFRISMEDPEALRSLVPECSEGLEQIINRALMKDRELRYQSLRDLRRDAESLLFELQQQRAKGLLDEARKLLDVHQFNNALATIHEALDLDPGNREIRQLRESIQRDLQKKTVQSRVDAMLQTAEGQLKSRDFPTAIQTLELALKLDTTNEHTRASLEAARAGMQRCKEAVGLVAGALLALRNSDLASALEKASESARLDPENAEATRVLAEVEKQRALKGRLQQIETLGTQGDLDACVRELNQLASQYPESKEVKRILEEAVMRKAKADRVRAVLADAEQSLQKSRFEDAIAALTKALENFPQEPGIAALLAKAQDRRRADGIEKAVHAAASLRDAGDFDGSLREIDSALLQFPDRKLTDLRAELVRAKSARERDLFVKKTVAQCNQLRASHRLAEALDAVQTALKKYDQEPVLLGLERELREQKELQQRAEAVRQSVEAGQKLFDQDRFQQAVELLQNETDQYPEEVELRGLLGRAKGQLQAQQRREGVEKASVDAQAAAELHDFPHAVAILEKALQLWPGESRLEEQLHSTKAARSAKEREEAIDILVREGLHLRTKDRLGDALRIIQGGLVKYKQAPALVRLEAELREQLEREQRAAGARGAAEEGQRLLEEGRFQQAVDVLEQACARYPETPDLQTQLSVARQMLKEHQQREAVEKAAREAQGSAERQDFAHALEILDKALKSWPTENRLIELRQMTLAARTAWEREQAIDAVVRECDQLRAGRHLAEALEVVQAGLKKYGQEASLLRLERDVRSQLERQQRAEDIARNLDEAQKLLTSGHFQQAVQMLEKACDRHRGETDLQTLLNRAKEGLRAQQKKAAIEEAAREAQSWAGKHDFKRAFQVLEKALDAWPGEDQLEKLLQATKAAQAAKDRQQEIEALVRKCNQLRTNNSLAEALGVLQAALRKYEREPALVRLESEVREQWELQQRAEAVKRSVEEGQRLLAQGQTRQAVDTLEKARAEYGEAKELLALLTAAKQQREAVEQAVREVESRTQQHNFAQALESLEKALKTWPREDRLLELLKATRAAQEAWHRQQAVEAVTLECKQLVAKQRLGDALAVIEEGLRKHPQEPALARLESEVREQWERQERAEAIRRNQEEGQRLLETGRFQLAADLLAKACDQYPDQIELRTLLNRAKAEVLAQTRRQEVERTALEAQGWIDRQDFKQALQILQNALEDWPGESRLEALVQSANTARVAKEREQGVEAVVRECDQLIAKRKVSKAQKAIQAGLRKYPSEPALLRLQEELLKQAEPSSQDQTPTPGGWSGRLVYIGLGLLVVGAGAFLVPRLFRANQVNLSVSSNVEGVSIEVEGGNQKCVTPNCSLMLSAGTYKVIATKPGYKTLSHTVALAKDSSELKLPLTLEPLPQMVHVNTNFVNGQAFLDGRPVGDLRNGQVTLSDVSPGAHGLKVVAGEAQFEIGWRNAIGSAPELQATFSAKNVQATVITNVGQTGTISCDCDLQTIKVDGNPVTATKSGPGVQVTGLAEGVRRINIGDRSLVVDVRPNPSLNVFLALDRDVGTLLIETSEDGAKVYINGRQYSRLTEQGSLRIPLAAGQYTLRVEKDGFKTPLPQTLDLGKKEERQLAFLLSPVPPVLEITGALPAVQVKVDGQMVGETAANGSLRVEVSTGSHVVALTKQDYSQVTFQSEFPAGRTIRPDKSQIAMVRAPKPAPPPAAPPPGTPPTVTTPPVTPPVVTATADAQDWERIRNSNNPDEFDDYIRKHPGSSLLDDARARLSQLRAQAEAAAARQAEQTAWNGVDKNNKAALQDFLSRYGSGPHVQEARGLIAGLDRQQADAIAAAQRLKEQREKEKEKEQASAQAQAAAQAQANAASADSQSIDRTLSTYEAAYNAKDIRALQGAWQAMPKNMADATRRQFGDAKTVKFQIRPLERPVINGDTARVTCTRTLSLTMKTGQEQSIPGERVRVTLGRVAGAWLILSITPL